MREILETKDLVLRKALMSDWKAMYENVWRHPETARYMLWDVTTSEADARARMERTIAFQASHPGTFTVAEKISGQAIGYAGLQEAAPGVWEETGIALGPDFTGKGYGKQIVKALTDYAFRERGAERFVYVSRAENIPSIALAERCGFRFTHSESRTDPRNGEAYTLNFYENRRTSMKEVNITTFGHACFLLECDGYKVGLDPYAWGMVPGQPDLHMVVDALYCSHEHADHNFREAVGLHLSLKPQPYTLTEFVTPHDDRGGALRGMNTVRIFDFDGLRVAHLGDIGCFPDEELTKALTGVDCLLIPVGGTYTIGTQTAYQIIRTLKPRVAVPMHYRTDKTGFDNIAHINDFVKLWDDVRFVDNTFTLTPETEPQILVLNYKGE